MIIEAVTGAITREQVDAVVNAANERLVRGGGVCGAIFAAAGRELESACADLGGCAVGDAKATPGFALPARWIVHTVGPVWRGGGFREPELLASCYRRCTEVAAALGAHSIAFPAISTGIFGYPRGPAAEIAIRTLRDGPQLVEIVRLVAFDQEVLRIYEDLLEA